MIEYYKSQTLTPSHKGEKPVESKGAMLELQYEMNDKLDTSISINLQNLLIILNVEYIMVLTNVFLNAMPQQVAVEEETDKPSLPPTPTHSVALEEQGVKPALIPGSQVALVPEKGRLEHAPEMKVTINVKDPQIVILADAQDKNTNALFLHVCDVFEILLILFSLNLYFYNHFK